MRDAALTPRRGRAVIPPFHGAVDRALSYLDPVHGLLGVADFFASGKHDLPLRQMSWARRFFWHSIFDTDGIHIGPERRAYLDHKLSRVWEMNSQVGLAHGAGADGQLCSSMHHATPV